ncbi:MAG: UbiA family prenyltransferase [Sulfurospirillaceae bacterium]|nr:UbiA family prenyltransferase [Sulfurospirillaceae bacterium]
MKTAILIDKQGAGVKDYIALTKAYLSFAVMIPGALSYLLFADEINPGFWLSVLAIFLLALGVSALNQFQERQLDALMPRTQNRPLVTGSISEKEALGIIIGLIGTSTLIEYYVLGISGVVIFAFVVILYNAIYTPMKRTSAYAVFPGAILGVIPTVLCTMATDQSVFSPSFLAIAWFYFIWQIPHFWLLVLMYQNDYNKAKFPNMANVVGAQSLSHITYVWILLTIISALMVVSFFIPKSTVIFAFIILHSIFLAYKSFVLLRDDAWSDKRLCKKIFMQLNLYTLAVVVFLVIDRWLVQ